MTGVVPQSWPFGAKNLHTFQIANRRCLALILSETFARLGFWPRACREAACTPRMGLHQADWAEVQP